MCHIKAGNGFIRARGREGDKSPAQQQAVSKKREERDWKKSNRTRERRYLRAIAKRAREAGEAFFEAGERGIENLIEKFRKQRGDAT